MQACAERVVAAAGVGIQTECVLRCGFKLRGVFIAARDMDGVVLHDVVDRCRFRFALCVMLTARAAACRGTGELVDLFPVRFVPPASHCSRAVFFNAIAANQAKAGAPEGGVSAAGPGAVLHWRCVEPRCSSIIVSHLHQTCLSACSGECLAARLHGGDGDRDWPLPAAWGSGGMRCAIGDGRTSECSGS